MLFRKRAAAVEVETTKKPSMAPISDTGSDPEIAKDTIVSILRTLSEFSLPTQTVPKLEFEERCQQLAVMLLLKCAPRIQDGQQIDLATVHKEIRHLVREQRRAESSEYARHRESTNIIVGDLVAGLRRSLEIRQGHDEEVVILLAQMENAVAGGDLKTIRDVAAKTAARIKTVISAERENDRMQLEQLTGQLRTMREELDVVRSQMRTDPLTGLNNRGAFDKAFEKMVQLCHASSLDLTVFMVDLDRFKNVNDVHGHQAGDEVLRSVGRQLIRCFPRKEDLVARYGGEEFVILCRDTGEDNAEMLAERVRSSIERMSIALPQCVLKTTVSVGYAVLLQGESESAFLKRSDDALYEAKRKGRNRVEGAKTD